MSVVTVQLGQCGNQIGGQLFSTISQDLISPATGVSQSQNQNFIETSQDRFFTATKNGMLQARAVMVDMEPKVIAQTALEARKSGCWCYSSKQQFCQKRGSGNNWAHGFCVHGSKAREDVMNIVQTEVEKCDRFDGFLNLMSLAGGTGSGVGAYITAALRDEYPHSFIVNQVVSPYNTGEVIVQNYNAVLTLSHLYQASDAVVILENDQLQKICSQLLNIKKVSFRDINHVISHKLASILQPAYQESGGRKRTNHLGDMLEHLVPQPEYKLLTIKNIPQISEAAMQYSTYQWQGLLKHLRQMLIADAGMEEGIDWQVRAPTTRGSNTIFNKSMANLLILRGKDIDSADSKSFEEDNLYTPWIPHGFGLSLWKQNRMFNKYEKSATLLSNSQSPVKSLDHIVHKAWDMFAARAYVHQYLKHGLTEEEFLDCFACLEQVVKNYKDL